MHTVTAHDNTAGHAATPARTSDGQSKVRRRVTFTVDDAAHEKLKELAVQLGVARPRGQYPVRFTVRIGQEVMDAIAREAELRNLTPVDVGREWLERGRPKEG